MDADTNLHAAIISLKAQLAEVTRRINAPPIVVPGRFGPRVLGGSSKLRQQEEKVRLELRISELESERQRLSQLESEKRDRPLKAAHMATRESTLPVPSRPGASRLPGESARDVAENLPRLSDFDSFVGPLMAAARPDRVRRRLPSEKLAEIVAKIDQASFKPIDHLEGIARKQLADWNQKQARTGKVVHTFQVATKSPKFRRDVLRRLCRAEGNWRNLHPNLSAD